jgi:hypothetical protein
MFRTAVSPGSIHEPIKHLRRGVEIQVIAPKVSAAHAAAASTAVGCAELIEVCGYSRGCDKASPIQYVSVIYDLCAMTGSHRVVRRCPIPREAVSSGSLVEVEFYIRIAPQVNQGSHTVRYELCSICVVDDTVFQL